MSPSPSPSDSLFALPKAESSTSQQISARDIALQEPVSEKLTRPDELTCRAGIPRADGGRDAWLFLAGCFILEALVWGFPFCFGVFETYYSNHPSFQHQPGIAAIGTCSTGIMYLIAPVTITLYERYPSIRRAAPIFGLILMICALLASSFSTRVWQLIVTQGVLYGIGGSALYAPTVLYLDEWFVQRKGLAFGIMWAGVGVAGLLFPFVLKVLLDSYGYAVTLRVWCVVLFVFCAPLIYYIKPRVPIPNPPPPRHKASYSFLLTQPHLSLQISNILESLSFFLPSIYLPSYSNSLSLPRLTRTLLLSLLNTASVFGTIIFGCLSDHFAITHIIALSCTCSSLSALLLWGLGTNVAVLTTFALCWGFFAGGYSALWTGMAREVRRRDETVGAGVLMGVFAAGRGVGAVCSGLISEALRGRRVVRGGGLGYGTEFGAVILYTAVCALGGLVCFVGGFGGGRRKKKSGKSIFIGDRL